MGRTVNGGNASRKYRTSNARKQGFSIYIPTASSGASPEKTGIAIALSMHKILALQLH